MIQMYQKPLHGKTVGVVFGAFTPLHQGHLDEIMRAKKENDSGCIVVVCGGNGDRGEPFGLPFKRRYRMCENFLQKMTSLQSTESTIQSQAYLIIHMVG